METIDDIINKARKLRFGPTSLAILQACHRGPQNPYQYFGHNLRRSWSYGYFWRLYRAGLIIQVSTPNGCKGHHWYITA